MTKRKSSLSLPEGLSMEEWELVQDFRKRTEQARWFNNGIETAAQVCESWASEAGEYGEGYSNLAKHLRRQKIAIRARGEGGE